MDAVAQQTWMETRAEVLAQVKAELVAGDMAEPDVMGWLHEQRPGLYAEQLLFLYLGLKEACKLVPTGPVGSQAVEAVDRRLKYTPHGFRQDGKA